MRYANGPPKILKFLSSQMVTLVGGSVTEGKKLLVLTVPPPSKPIYLTARAAPPSLAKEVGRVKMSLSRVNIEASVSGPPARYTRAGKSSTITTTANVPAKNIRASRSAISEHLMRMMEVVSWMKEKTYTYKIESLIELAN